MIKNKYPKGVVYLGGYCPLHKCRYTVKHSKNMIPFIRGWTSIRCPNIECKNLVIYHKPLNYVIIENFMTKNTIGSFVSKEILEMIS